MASLEGGLPGRDEGNFLSLGWDTVIGGWATIWPTALRWGENRDATSLLFSLNGLKGIMVLSEVKCSKNPMVQVSFRGFHKVSNIALMLKHCELNTLLQSWTAMF